MTSFFARLMHGAEAAGKGIATAGKDVGKVALICAPVAAAALPGPLGAIADHVVQMVPHNAPVPPEIGIAGATAAFSSILTLSAGADSTVNPLETFAIAIVLSTLQSVIKNPVHCAALETQLLGVADDIYRAYGRTPATLQSDMAVSTVETSPTK